MASVDKRPNGQWRARWREYPGGPQTTRTFPRKVDAERHLVDVQHRLLSGTYMAPEAGRVTLEGFYATWFARMAPTWRPRTADAVRNNFERNILPVLGRKPLTVIRRSDVEALCAALPFAPSTVAVVAQHLGQLLRSAVDDGLLVKNPAYRARLPKNDAARPEPVPAEVLERVHAALPDWLAVAVPLGVGAGLRQGEASGLTVDRIQFLRRTLRIDRQLVNRGVPRPTLAPPKSKSSHRTIPLASIVVEALSEHLRRFPGDQGDLVLRHPDGRPICSDLFGQQWRRAVREAGVPGLKYHALRHTFASTLLSRGVSVKAVGDWLGHASPVITLNTYAHLMPTDEEVARTVLDEALAPAAEDWLRTGGAATRG